MLHAANSLVCLELFNLEKKFGKLWDTSFFFFLNCLLEFMVPIILLIIFYSNHKHNHACIALIDFFFIELEMQVYREGSI
jgi:hypothetical protein